MSRTRHRRASRGGAAPPLRHQGAKKGDRRVRHNLGGRNPWGSAQCMESLVHACTASLGSERGKGRGANVLLTCACGLSQGRPCCNVPPKPPPLSSSDKSSQECSHSAKTRRGRPLRAAVPRAHASGTAPGGAHSTRWPARHPQTQQPGRRACTRKGVDQHGAPPWSPKMDRAKWLEPKRLRNAARLSRAHLLSRGDGSWNGAGKRPLRGATGRAPTSRKTIPN